MKYIVAVCAGILLVSLCAAQEQTESILDLQKQLSALRAELDSLKAAGQTQGAEDELDLLDERIEKRLEQLENKIDAATRMAAPIALNPRTTAFINFAARGDSKTVMDETGQSQISNRPFLRSVEMELSNAVDPYAEAVAIITLEDQAGRGFAVDAEEAYGLVKRLPLLETAPLGMKLRVGKFRAPIGVDNKIHMHDLPWTTRPLVISKFLGTEHGNFFESGFNPTGLDADFFLPNPLPMTTLEMHLSLVRAGELGLFSNPDIMQPGYIGHLTLSRDWSNVHLLLLGVSLYQERGPTRLMGADITYKWAPAEDRESHSLVAGGEFFSGKVTAASPSGFTSSPYGWFAYLQYQTSYWVYLGFRYDWLQEPADNQLVTESIGAYLSYYTTEFLRFRIGVEHRTSDLPQENDLTTGLLEINFVFGSHPAEPYWVNR
jgi:hypothetical protein